MRNPRFAATSLIAVSLLASGGARAQGCAATGCANPSASPLYSSGVLPTSGAYTVASSDCVGASRFYEGTAATTVTVPTGLSNGCHLKFKQSGTGFITFAYAGGTLASFGNATHTAGQGAIAEIVITTSGVSLSGQVQ